MSNPKTLKILALGLTLFLTAGGYGGEAEIIARMEAFFVETDIAKQQELARLIESDPAYDRSQVSRWLHAADLFPPQTPGEKKINIDLERGEFRTVLLRIPPNYSSSKSWPVIIAYHGNGEGEASSLHRVKRLLGDRIDEFIIANPANYAQDVIDTIGEPSVEHLAVIEYLRTQFNVDSDRVFVFGKSAGGFCAWTLATLHPDQYAGAMPMACAYSVPAFIDSLWETMLPNVRHLPIIHVWGRRDDLRCLQVLGVPPDPTIAGMNQSFEELVSQLDLKKLVLHGMPKNGHFGMAPPPDGFEQFLASRRIHSPQEIEHHFRYLYQSRVYWLEGHEWVGEQWRMDTLLFLTIRREGEAKRKELGPWIEDRLGYLRGRIEGQRIEIQRKHIGEMTVWIHEGMTRWDEPLQVVVDEETVFEDRLSPDLFLALTQARRTRDFDRLRWAGLRIGEAGEGIRETGRSRFKPLMEIESKSLSN